jgi:SAM-dependent methyltransferase
MPVDPRHRTTPSVRRPDAVLALRRALAAANYTFTTVRELLGADETLLVLPHQVPLANRRLGDGPLGTLIRLFLVDGAVTPEQATRALSPLSLQEAINIGVVSLGRSRVHGAVRIVPSDGLNFVFASDLDSNDPTDLPPDFVMGVTESSRLLANLTARRPVERALDVGTGCGFQAIFAAQHAQQVVATDINPRAVAFARFNAVLNGAENVEARVGDGFGPVEGELFDMIVCNPPFVISPDRSYTYRDSGLEGDAISHDLVHQMPRFLRSGGLGHVLVSWIHARSSDADDEWADPLRRWVAEASDTCDAWLLRKGSYDPLAYAIMWNQRLALANQMPKYVAAVDRWTRYFEHLEVGALAWGAVWLRRRETDRPRVRADELPDSALDREAAAELLRLLEVEDRLEAFSDLELLECVVSVSGDQRLEQVMRWSGGAFRTVDASLVREVGLKPRLGVDPPLAAVLAAMDGSRTVGGILEHAARALGGNPEAVSAQGLPAIRELLAHGFLTLNG